MTNSFNYVQKEALDTLYSRYPMTKLKLSLTRKETHLQHTIHSSTIFQKPNVVMLYMIWILPLRVELSSLKYSSYHGNWGTSARFLLISIAVTSQEFLSAWYFFTLIISVYINLFFFFVQPSLLLNRTGHQTVQKQ